MADLPLDDMKHKGTDLSISCVNKFWSLKWVIQKSPGMPD